MHVYSLTRSRPGRNITTKLQWLSKLIGTRTKSIMKRSTLFVHRETCNDKVQCMYALMAESRAEQRCGTHGVGQPVTTEVIRQNASQMFLRRVLRYMVVCVRVC